MWIVTTLILSALVAALAWKFGPDVALGGGILISLVIPVWLRIDVWGLPVDLRTVVAILGLGIYCIHPDARLKTRVTSADCACIGLVAMHLISDTLNEGFGLGIVLLAFARWYVPFVSGRLVNRDTRNYDIWIRIACYLCVVFAGWSVVESTTRVNPANYVVEARPKDRTPAVSLRFGLKRAEGPTTHPIWFGMLQCLLFPYALTAATRAWRRRGPRWWLAVPFANVLGVFFTFSRGPVICLIISLLGFAAVQWRVRWTYVAGGLAVAVVGLTIWTAEIFDHLRWTEGTSDRHSQVELSGAKYKLDPTNYRLILLRAYSKAIREVPLWGYGTDRLASWPPRVPLNADARVVQQRIWSIDNEYLLILLRFGWVGLVCFFMAAVLATYFALQRALTERESRGVGALAAGLGTTLAAVVIILTGEWMPSDWGFLLFYSFGFASSLRDARPGKSCHQLGSRNRTRDELPKQQK